MKSTLHSQLPKKPRSLQDMHGTQILSELLQRDIQLITSFQTSAAIVMLIMLKTVLLLLRAKWENGILTLHQRKHPVPQAYQTSEETLTSTHLLKTSPIRR